MKNLSQYLNNTENNVDESYNPSNAIRPVMNAFSEFINSMQNVKPTKEHVTYMADVLCKYEPEDVENIIDFLTQVIKETKKYI